MPSGLIFITGTTGFIGSAVALEALKTGYQLRISVRRESQILKLKTLFSKYGYSEKVDFVVVADITQESSFAGKLDGVDYVLHIASPLLHGTEKESYLDPAVKGTTAILTEAAKVKSIKKVVITSSIAAFIPVAGLPKGGVIKENNPWDFTIDPSADFTVPKNDSATAMRLYHASKLLAYNAAWDFKKDQSPHFSLVTLHPAFVFGHNHLQTTADEIKGGTNEMFFGTIMTGAPLGNITAVHIQDVAEAHVKALNESVPDGSTFLLAGERAAWKDVARIVGREYSKCGARIGESIPGESWDVDTTKAERELGMKWRSLDVIVRDVMDQQLGFRKGGVSSQI
ncbi:3-beta hydroxysteroid dehydrogenase/isomerase family protein [Aspergillus steynii IBT 23096]|uniref:3-beta hydroxysteroid dehydrogenase/isomerase family protein n=1 Tax=Aspergillus steynii IBT 23096 TaxID=1392250 RepID=A0A2I2G6B2_9EURO|nr:3-beta hydroxysteroid dehydrogenase/isomerase family protein [Aspergillus steynii IBT 23096]PLB48417.1 3-beta hydroxysteroid dehydrogenase/isomerase family protein [Aspergillus steynii IBT 23096]